MKNATITIFRPMVFFSMGALFLFVMNVASKPAHAEAAGNFDFFDGIIAQCVVSTNKRYARNICDHLTTAAQKNAQGAGIAFSYIGSDTNRQSERDNRFKQPVQLIFYVRGTSGANVGASVRITAGIDMVAAIDTNGAKNQPQRKGFLVLWERAAVGEGPARKMTTALSQHMGRKMQELFDLLAAAKSP